MVTLSSTVLVVLFFILTDLRVNVYSLDQTPKTQIEQVIGGGERDCVCL